jgi:hypothetical protein
MLSWGADIMKKSVIDLEELAQDIRDWGVAAEIHYDENEEAYVLHAGTIQSGQNAGRSELTIAPGFKYFGNNGEERIFAYAESIYVVLTESHPVNSSMRSNIVSQSRLGFHQQEKVKTIIR